VGHLTQFKMHAKSLWRKYRKDQRPAKLDARDQLARQIAATDGVSRDQAEQQIDAFERQVKAFDDAD
jgi:hypothetical protein